MANFDILTLDGSSVSFPFSSIVGRIVDVTHLDIIWLTISAGLVFLMQAGFTCLESGLTRSKNSINVAIKNISDFGVSVILFWLIGFGLMFDVSLNSWLSGEGLSDPVSAWRAAFFLFQAMFCGTAVTIVSGAVAERVRFWPYLIAVCFVSGLIYPLFGNWAWASNGGGDPGWLEFMGFRDFAGATVVHSMGGWVALAFALVVGPRDGRFPKEGPPRQIAGHNLPLAVVGAWLLWFGWLGFNGGSTYAADVRVPLIIVKTVLAGASGLVVGLLAGLAIRKKADVFYLINGSLAGLVAITAGCSVVSLGAAVGIGAAGAICMIAADRMLERFRIDDAVGATAVHAASGACGTVAVALFAPSQFVPGELTRLEFFGVQCFGVVVCCAWAFGLSIVFFLALNRFYPVRATLKQERDGLNISEHGATTELLDLFRAMDEQAAAGDISLRAPVEPFTEVGQIAGLYNRVLDSLQSALAQTDAIVRSASDAIITFTRRGQVVTSVNPSALLMFRASPDQFLHQPIKSFLPENGDLKMNNFDPSEGVPTRLPVETTAERADGTRFAAEVAVTSIGAGDEAGYVATIRDISARQRAQARLKTTVEAAPNAMLIVDADGKIVMANRQAKSLFEYESGELINQSIEILVPRDVRGKHDALRREFMKAPSPRPMGTGRDLYGVTKSGEKIPLEIGLAPIELNDGTCVITSIVDISQRTRLTNAMAQAHKAAEEANQAKSDFLANMSHDIRTPLNAILGMTELLLEMDLSPTQREYLTIVHESSESLLDLINEILDFSKIEAGRLELDSLPFDLEEDIGNALRSIALKAHDKNLELAWQIDPDVPRFLTGDPGRLRQVVLNLVGNAIKFTREGEVVLSIAKRSQTEDRVRLRFSVRDTGPGIPPDKRETIFAPFEQVDSSSTRQYAGSGLGLAIVSRIVEAMDGRIWVESKLNEGSTFSFDCEFSLADGRPARVDSAPAELTGVPVVVLDDNAANRLILHELLSGWGMRVLLAEQGTQAIEALSSLAKSGRPRPLLISDVQMPDLDGFEVARRIRADRSISKAVIILLTSSIHKGDLKKCRDLDVSAHLMKPVKPSELLEMLWRGLGRGRERPEPESSRRVELPPLEILLVEDGHANRRFATALLEKWGHAVTWAENGSLAVDLLAQRNFDVVLMDVQMPVMDGLTAAREIRRREKEAKLDSIPIVAMTARAMKGDRERCLQAGMNDYISKPIRRDELMRVLARFVRREAPAPTKRENQGGRVNWKIAYAGSDHDEGILKVVIEATIEELPELDAEIQRQLAAGNLPEIGRLAHTIKAAGRTFGDEQLIETASEIERLAAEGALAELSEPVEELRRISRELVREIQQYQTENHLPK